jgi:hypothetical protein
LKVGILEECSGIVRDAFIAAGHDAISCDLKPTRRPGPHIQGDVLVQDWRGFDLLICHPDCTYLANSGVHWLGRQPGRWDKMVEAAHFFRWHLDLPCPCIAVENPVMHGHALGYVGRRHDQTVQPYQFGDPASKRTCIWLKGLPPLQPTNVLPLPACGYWPNQTPSGQNKLGPSEMRKELRSNTYPGIAAAMAAQWGIKG